MVRWLTELTCPDEGEGVALGGGDAGGDGELVSALPIEGLLDARVALVLGCAEGPDGDGDVVAAGDAGDPPPLLDVTYP